MVASIAGSGGSRRAAASLCVPSSGALSPQRDPPNTTVLVVDDHPVVRAGIEDILRYHDWLEVVGQAADGSEGLRQARELAPNLMIVDINLPKLSGLALIRTVRSELPNTRSLVFSLHRAEQFALAMIESGAKGYVCKTAPGTELIRGLETVAGGGTYFDADFSRKFLANYSREGTGYGMSPREREVLIGIAEGLSSKQIAARLDIGVRTVDTHRERLVRKLNIREVANLTRFAIQQGLVVAD